MTALASTRNREILDLPLLHRMEERVGERRSVIAPAVENQ